MYIFSGLEPGRYFIAAAATAESSSFTTSMPNFFGNESEWVNGTPVKLIDDMINIDVAIELFSPVNEIWNTGDDSITRIVTFAEKLCKKSGGETELTNNPLPVHGAIVNLLDVEGNLLSFTVTDEFGAFNLGSLAPSLYELNIQYVGTSISLSEEIVIDGGDQVGDEYRFKVEQDKMDEDITGVFDSKMNNIHPIYSVYPNPTKKSLNIQLPEALQNKTVNYTITPITGNKVISSYTNSSEELYLDVSTLAEGTYFIKISGVETTGNYKFTKQ
jgi:hypothetical protein